MISSYFNSFLKPPLRSYWAYFLKIKITAQYRINVCQHTCVDQNESRCPRQVGVQGNCYPVSHRAVHCWSSRRRAANGSTRWRHHAFEISFVNRGVVFGARFVCVARSSAGCVQSNARIDGTCFGQVDERYINELARLRKLKITRTQYNFKQEFYTLIFWGDLLQFLKELLDLLELL